MMLKLIAYLASTVHWAMPSADFVHVARKPKWPRRLLPLLPKVELTLLIGQYAQAYFLGARRKDSLTATMRAWREYLPSQLPLPHPSPRNVAWFKANPWFEGEVLPTLRERVGGLWRNAGHHPDAGAT